MSRHSFCSALVFSLSIESCRTFDILAMNLGTRVVRGPDWSSCNGETDGGEGCVGTVAYDGENSAPLPKNLVWVQWDVTGLRKTYRAGYHEAYDLRILDRASAGEVHPTIMCSACEKGPIRGMCWHCLNCQVTCNLCTSCYMSDEHEKDHQFERIDRPGLKGANVGKRRGASTLQAKGIFRGAKVVRGPDWNWEDQDGGEGKEGVVIEIRSWKQHPACSALISWDCAKKGTYRVGFQGKVDLKCVQPATGCYYYNLHLPVLGPEEQEDRGVAEETQRKKKQRPDKKPSGERVRYKRDEQSDRDSEKRKTTRLKTSELNVKGATKKDEIKSKGKEKPHQETSRRVHIKHKSTKVPVDDDLEKEEAVVQQQKHKCSPQGQEESQMSNERPGKELERNETPEKEEIENLSVQTEKTSEITIEVGDTVCVSLPEDIVKEINQDFGWTEQMRQHLGETGKFIGNTSNGGRRVRYSDKLEFTFHPDVVSKSDGDTKRKLKQDDTVRISDDRESVRMLQKGHGPWNDTVFRVLGKEGRVFGINQSDDIEVLVEDNGEQTVVVFNPEALELQQTRRSGQEVLRVVDPDFLSMLKRMGVDDHAIHAAAAAAEEESIRQTQPTTEADMVTKVLGGAASSGDVKAVKHLLDRHPGIIDNVEGMAQTALQKACHSGHSELVSLLLERGASTEKQDVQGYSALHHAAFSDMTGVTASLLIQKGANLNDNRNRSRSTPLHVALKQFNETTAIILVQAGCDVNLQEDNGATALHMAATVGLFDATKHILNSKDVIVDVCNGEGLNPLQFMLTKRGTFVAKVLLEIKPEIAVVPDRTGTMPLHFAALYDDMETAEHLLETGKCDINHRNCNGLTALDLAKAAGSLSVLELLIAHSKQPNEKEVDHEFKVSLRTAAALNCSKGGEIKTGDIVRVKTDKGLVAAYQVGHGGWNDSMMLTLGKVGYVEHPILPNNDLRVYIEEFSHTWVFNQAAVELVTYDDEKLKATESNETAEDLDPDHKDDGDLALRTQGTLDDESNQTDTDVDDKVEETLAPGGGNADSMTEEDMKRRMICCICMDRRIEIVFQCGHCTCKICCGKIRLCPVCNQKIKYRQPVFL